MPEPLTLHEKRDGWMLLRGCVIVAFVPWYKAWFMLATGRATR